MNSPLHTAALLAASLVLSPAGMALSAETGDCALDRVTFVDDIGGRSFVARRVAAPHI